MMGRTNGLGFRLLKGTGRGVEELLGHGELLSLVSWFWGL